MKTDPNEDFVLIAYDGSKGNSYRQMEAIEEEYGPDVMIDEVRDKRGYLTHFKVIFNENECADGVAGWTAPYLGDYEF